MPQLPQQFFGVRFTRVLYQLTLDKAVGELRGKGDGAVRGRIPHYPSVIRTREQQPGLYQVPLGLLSLDGNREVRVASPQSRNHAFHT